MVDSHPSAGGGAEEHWVFAVVSVTDQRIYFFDSLGQRQGWRRDIRVGNFPLFFTLAQSNLGYHDTHYTYGRTC